MAASGVRRSWPTAASSATRARSVSSIRDCSATSSSACRARSATAASCDNGVRSSAIAAGADATSSTPPSPAGTRTSGPLLSERRPLARSRRRPPDPPAPPDVESSSSATQARPNVRRMWASTAAASASSIGMLPK